ncbi:MAG: hypothetical protein NUW24_13235 [Anaerolineae bacterium]|nr:hypothetical protein [Anaerolineae bacterium]MDH7474264.1 hypothetical protein [Anaerolineae bacterium]
MATDKENLGWLKAQVRSAAFQTIAISVITFGVLLYLFLGNQSWKSYAAFAAGIIIGTLFGTSRPPNLFSFVPIRTPLKITEEEAMKRMMTYWKRFPRFYCWMANVPYLVVLLTMAVLTHREIHEPGFFLKAILGFFPSVFLCGGVFFTYVVFSWREED